MYCPDNYSRYELYEEEQERWLKSRPICDHCKEHIQDENLVDVNGFLYCEDCFDELVEKFLYENRRCTENYVN